MVTGALSGERVAQLYPDFILPALRQDLRILKGAADEDGAPRWLIFDPVAGKYYTVSWQAVELIRQWQTGASALTFIQQQPLVDFTGLQAFTEFLTVHGLTLASSPADTRRLVSQYQHSVHGWFLWLIHNYLFIRIPLLKPDAWLSAVYPHLRFLFRPWLRISLCLLGMTGLFLTSREWDSFTSTFMHYFSWSGVLFYGFTLACVKSLHELGHALVAKHHGCRVSSIGIAFIVLSPILYTDTTDAWKLRSRYQRLDIVTAGIRVELYIACVAVFLWGFLPDCTLRSAAFFVATTSIVTSVLINLSPFMRFDGYYAFSDWLGIENLQPRAFAVGRWFLRQCLFGLRREPPEHLSVHRKMILVSYAWFTWIYRLTVFTGIAMLVYYFAFKVLGIVLFLVEIIFFVALPVMREIHYWWKIRRVLTWNVHSAVTLCGMIALLILLLTPWQHTLLLPAVLKEKNYYKVYAPEPGVIQSVLVHKGQFVSVGQPLFSLRSDDVEEARQKSAMRIHGLQEQLARVAAVKKNLETNNVVLQQLKKEQEFLLGLDRRAAALQVKAPVAGQVSDIVSLHIGQPISTTDPLIAINGRDQFELLAFVASADLQALHPGAEATFMANDGRRITSIFRITSISDTSLPALPYPELASVYDGPVAAKIEKDTVLTPEEALFTVRLQSVDASLPVTTRLTGHVRVVARPQSLLSRFWSHAMETLIKESSF